ncbi:TPA: response regulator transcription factor [Klebsiella aerogenes]|nr:response regulator transcription factor [Klebsiella aerogenes]HEC1359290.1 response regulator transcription factor [Klebsiella aerogenes]
MANILIYGVDEFFRQGLMHLISTIFNREYNEKVTFFSDLSAETVWNADVILISLRQGELHTCKEELDMRRKGVIIGLVDFQHFDRSEIPSCISDISFVNKKSSVDNFYARIVSAWNYGSQLIHYPRTYKCACCIKKQLTPREFSVAKGLLIGKTAKVIASELNVSRKTVFSNKYSIMKKYKIDSNKNLLLFLTSLIENDPLS